MSHDHFGGAIQSNVDGADVVVRYRLGNRGAVLDAVILDGAEINPGYFDAATVQRIERECEAIRVVDGWALP